MKPVFIKLAFLEYFRSANVRAPGGRDFLWMTMLMFFIQLLALVILTAREGVLERSVDAFLGNKPGFGIPVWTLPNFLGENQPVLISSELIDDVEQGGYLAAPFRRLNNDQMIRLPDKKIWAENTKVDEIKFSGMAADFNGPMVPHDSPQTQPSLGAQDGLISGGKTAEPNATAQQFGQKPYMGKNGYWNIVLDEKLFGKYFDSGVYAQSLKGKVPQSVIDQIPTQKSRMTDMDQIWLAIKVHKTEYLMPFNVKWSKYFGIGTGNTAFIVPIELLNYFNVAKENPKTCAFMESGPKLGRRILSLKSDRLIGMPKISKDAIRSDFESLASVIGGTVDNVGSRIELYLGDRDKDRKALRSACDAGTSELRLMLVANDLGLTDIGKYFNEMLESDTTLSVHPYFVNASCRTLSARTLKSAVTVGEGNKCVAKIPMATEGTGYSEMLLFARKRVDIKNLVDFTSCRPTKQTPNPMVHKHLCIAANSNGDIVESRLMINQIYEDSLTRFGFLTELLNGISGPIGAVMIGMLAAILWVQLGTVLGHRRFRYAMLLSNGISWAQLKLMIITQVILGIIISLGFAVGCFLLIKYYLINKMFVISTVYEKITLGHIIDVLPVGSTEILMVSASTMLVAIVLTLIQLALNMLSPRKPLEKLMD